MIVRFCSFSALALLCPALSCSDSFSLLADVTWECAKHDGHWEVIGFSYAKEQTMCKCAELKIPSTVGDVKIDGVGQYAFKSNQDIAAVVVPSNITFIGREAFYACSNLTSLIFEPGQCGLTISADAFADCVRLKKVDITKRATMISAYAFANCSSLKEVVLSRECYNVDERCFSRCANLLRIDMSNVSSDWMSAFQGCDSLIDVVVSKENPTYKTWNGMLVYRNRNVFLRCPSGLRSNKIDLTFRPELICPFAFESCQAKEVILYEGLKAIGTAAFNLCTNIVGISIPSTVELIDDYAFFGCSNLVTITFCGDKLPELGECVFPSSVKFNGACLSPSQISILEHAKDTLHSK